nr:MAG TPA: PGDYG protein [Caudoviricetes sp.]
MKKPVVIEAFQLNERGLVAEDWFWNAVTENTIITHDFGKYYPNPAWCEIKTLEGTMIAKAGDYIIRGVKGEIYPCKPDIFKMIYEAVE